MKNKTDPEQKTFCLSCKSKRTYFIGKKSNFRFYRCKNCSFVFVDPLPTAKQLENFYNRSKLKVDLKSLIKKSIDKIEKSPNSPKRDWFEYILNISKKYTGKRTLNILEIGSAYGYFIHYANLLGHNAIGTEVTSEFALASRDLIKGKVLFINGNLYSKHFKKKSIDLVYLEHVFEHVNDPVTVIKQLSLVLADNGVIILSVPNINSLMSRVLNFRWVWVDPPNHLFYYNVDSLRVLFNNNGFKIIRSWTGDYYFRSIYQFFSLINWNNRVRKVINIVFNKDLKRISHAYIYPDNILQYINLIPYWIFFPFIKISHKLGSGSELVVVLMKK